jgi:hypothetical protein
VTVGFEFLHVGSVKFGVPVVWIHPLMCRWKIPAIWVALDHIGNPRIVRDPGGMLTDRAPDGAVVPRILLEELGHILSIRDRENMYRDRPEKTGTA